MHYNISRYLMSYSLNLFLPYYLETVTQSSRTVPEAIKMYLLEDWTFYLWVKR